MRREEYEALYNKQQATMTDFENIMLPKTHFAQESENSIKKELAATAVIGNKNAVSGSATAQNAVIGSTTAAKSAVLGSATAAKSANEEQSAAEKALEEKLAKVKVGITVMHKKFGEGTITRMDDAKKYMRIKFAVGEKQFIFPDAFVMGFLDITI